MNIQQEFLSLMDKGGSIMWVIFVVACITMMMLIWEAIRGLNIMKHALVDYQIIQSSAGILSAQKNGVSISASPIAQLLATVFWPKVETKEDIVKEFNLHLVSVSAKMEGSLATIAILGSLLPMLGLLGTVTGMINVFEVIAIQGSGKPEQMADGISQALLTTASGLIIAIPVIFFHHLLSSRTSVLMMLTHQSIQLVLNSDVNILKNENCHE